ncbi:TPM domain-containing protein [Fontimonas sp. SYSU GA230001]|uniref:TPM domain-containing protein n=1 Tax=Fontimonas sp. SYSU GA230001 TaxID=3142450 RepID=UPI0032B3D232
MRIARWWVGMVLGGMLHGAAALTPLPEALAHVSDLAGVFDEETAQRLGGVLSDYAAGSGVRIAVLTVDRTEDETAEAYAGRALRAWQTGDPSRRGALLLWTAQGQVVVRVGEGLRTRITDAQARAVLDEAVIPLSALGKFDQALMLGAYRLIQAANDTAAESAAGAEPASEPGQPPPAEPPADSAARDDAPFPLLAGADLALRQDLQRIAGAFTEDPAAALAWVLSRAQAQAAALPTVLPDALTRMLQAPEELIALAVAFVAWLFIVKAAWRLTGVVAVPVCVLPMGLAVLLWPLTRFTELCLLVLLAPPLAGIAWLLWRRRVRRGAQAAAAPNAYAAWLAAQQQKQRHEPPQSPTDAAARPPGVRHAGALRPMHGAAPPAAGAQRLADLLDRLHAAGTATPALDRVLVRWRSLASPQYRQQRTALLVTFLVLAVFFLPVALVAALAWTVSELNALKSPGQTLSGFFQQLSREAQALQRFQGHR